MSKRADDRSSRAPGDTEEHHEEGTEPIGHLIEAARREAERPASLERDAPVLSRLHGPEELMGDLARPLLSLARLPTWPKGPPEGHGWGKELNDLLGGGICPPYLLTIAGAAGVGKTAWIAQIADGLALRSAVLAKGKGEEPVTPVMLVSDTPASTLLHRSLARWTGVRAAAFRAGKSAGDETARAKESAVQTLIGMHGHARREWQRCYVRGLTGRALLEDLEPLVDEWRDEISKAHPTRPVWPVVVIDTIQRFAGTRRAESEAVRALAEGLSRRVRAKSWIAFVGSEEPHTPSEPAHSKEASKSVEGHATLRSAPALLHRSDAVLLMRRAPARPHDVGVVVLKNAWGLSNATTPEDKVSVAYRFDPEHMRFKPAGYTDDEKR